MVRLTRIYTRTGDDGTTALGDGSRVAKHSLRVAAFGAVDEANAALGVARLYLGGELDEVLARVQNDLFDLGADLCTPQRPTTGRGPLRVSDQQVRWLEQHIDRLNADLPSLRSFVLQGGSPAASYLHVARTVVRRAERQMVALAAAEEINPAALAYINRLSDWLFVASRVANRLADVADVLWEPGRHRDD